MAMVTPNAAFCAPHLDDDDDYDDDEYEKKKAGRVFFKEVGSARGREDAEVGQLPNLAGLN